MTEDAVALGLEVGDPVLVFGGGFDFWVRVEGETALVGEDYDVVTGSVERLVYIWRDICETEGFE